MVNVTQIRCVFRLILLSASVIRADVSFADSVGKIVDSGDEYSVRLVETPGSSIKTAEAVFTVDASVDSVFKVVTDYKAYPEFMPNITSSKYLDGPSDSAAWQFQFKVAAVKIRYSIRLVSGCSDGSCRMSWNYIEGKLKNTEGSWQILPFENSSSQSLVYYKTRTEPGLLVPGWVTNALTTKSIPGMISAIRERASSPARSNKTQ